METLLKYRFLEHLYTSSKYTYVEILCECLNKSKNMTLLTGVSLSSLKSSSKNNQTLNLKLVATL